MKSILLVEDDEASKMVVEDAVEYSELPVKLVHVISGEEALERVEEVDPILILMDIMLPGINGLKTAKKIQNNPATAHIPIWALTCLDMNRDGYRAIESGCTSYIRKPIKLEEFASQLKEFVEALCVPETQEAVNDEY